MSADSLSSQGVSRSGSRTERFHHRLFKRLRRHSSPGNSTPDDLLLHAYQSSIEFNLKNELYVCKRKLVSKCEALGVLCRELDNLRQERDDFKTSSQQSHARCQIMRRALGFGELLEEQMKPVFANGDEAVVHQLLFECIEHNKALQARNSELQEALENLQGDIRVLRDQAKDRPKDGPHRARLDPDWVQERCQMAQELEQNRIKLDQLQADFRTLLDEKEELVVERDALLGKYDRVNCELNYILKGDSGRILDIDAVVMENRYLQERLNHLQTERTLAYQAVSKYKSLLERHKSAVYDLVGQYQSASSMPHETGKSSRNPTAAATKAPAEMAQTTAKTLLGSTLAPTANTLRDLQSLARALVDTIQDRNLALTHQRKANRLLAERVADLERQVASIEYSGYWRSACSVFKAQSLDDVRNPEFPERVLPDSATSQATVDSSCATELLCLDRWPYRRPNDDDNDAVVGLLPSIVN